MNGFDPANFHFLRPLWLWGCLPALLLFILLWRAQAKSGYWHRAIDSALLRHLLADAPAARTRWPLLPLLAAWLVASIAVAGPVWEKSPQPVRQKMDALVIIQDLSLSLYAQDLSPNRLTRALQKLGDILHARQEGTTALVVYSGDAYVVAPLTDDTRTIGGMASALSPAIMPSYGSNPAAAVEKALQLLKDTAVSQGRLLLITDEISEADLAAISKLVGRTENTLSVLGVGTEEGGPIPMQEGGFLKDDRGKLIVPRLNRALLQQLAAENHGLYRDIRLTDDDINDLLAPPLQLPREEEYRRVEREFDQWRERGGWLTLLLLPVALFAFRRGWLLGLVLVLSLWSTECRAMNWRDLWQRPDQQAAAAMAQDDPQKAAALFRAKPWKAAAQYRAGDYEGAARTLADAKSADGRYNLGNALAKSGKLAEAVAAYEQALRIDPKLADAAANKKLVEELLAARQRRQDDRGAENRQDKDGQDGRQEQGMEPQGQEPGSQNGPQNPADSRQGERDGKASPSPAADRKAAGKPEKQEAHAAGGKTEPARQQPATEAGPQTAAKADQKPAARRPPAGADGKPLSEEQQQALQQWLRQIPDNPGGLLQRKFEYEYSTRQGRQNRRPEGKIW